MEGLAHVLTCVRARACFTARQARAIKMAIVHDVAESIVGDITPHCKVSRARAEGSSHIMHACQRASQAPAHA